MTITVALSHITDYRYDRKIALGPQVIRLRPAPHCRTPIVSFSQKISPDSHFMNWQQDTWSNWLGRAVFPEKTDHFRVEIDLIARMEAINPFDFYVEDYAQDPNFSYHPDLARGLKPFLGTGGRMTATTKAFYDAAPKTDGSTIDAIVEFNQYVQGAVDYIIRMEPGVQTPARTLSRGKGSCRDSAWLLINLLRYHGYAARFVSGYLIQLTSDLAAVDGPSGPTEDFTDLHAWAEVFLPGAGWVGLDPTSGLFAGEGHIPLAAAPEPTDAAPISGGLEPCEVTFGHEMSITRHVDPPRATKPLSDAQWSAVQAAGKAIDARTKKNDIRITVGGEPTFVAEYDRDAPEWTIDAVGPTKRDYADKLIRRLRERFAPDGMLHYGQGKWYPGEQLPRWSFELHWRGDGIPLWDDETLIASEDLTQAASKKPADIRRVKRFMTKLCDTLGVARDHAFLAYEDPLEFAAAEANLPVNLEARTNKMADPEARRRLVRVFERGLNVASAMVLPIQSAQAVDSEGNRRWLTERWKLRRDKLFLAKGDSPAGLRLPLEALPWLDETERASTLPRDPYARRRQLHNPHLSGGVGQNTGRSSAAAPAPTMQTPGAEPPKPAKNPDGYVRTALVVEPRDGRVCVFLPPVTALEDYVDLITAVEATAKACKEPVHVEGYTPPHDERLNVIKVTPDPGVIEVNIHPAASWQEQQAITAILYEEARQLHLDSSSFLPDGRPTGSGGGNHVVMGGRSVEDSPFLRRPDLLASILRYWQRHPSLSYLFSGLFVGPTCQAPRMDEARPDALFDLEMALNQLPAQHNCPPWLVDRLFRDLLTDATGNTHRAEVCIDKLYSPDGPTGRLGLVEFRAFEMPPHPRMAAVQSLVLIGLINKFWEQPYMQPPLRHGTALHDKYMLPHFLQTDFEEILADLTEFSGVTFDPGWMQAQLDFRFPEAGRLHVGDCELLLNHALEPWPVLGEDGTSSGTARFVDSSTERLQLKVSNLGENQVVTCNGIEIPLTEIDETTGVAGIRFRTWLPPRCLHPTVGPNVPLHFDVVDSKLNRSLGGIRYHAEHPGGRNTEERPINALEAEGRRLGRFESWHTPGPATVRKVTQPPEYVHTLDLRLHS